MSKIEDVLLIVKEWDDELFDGVDVTRALARERLNRMGSAINEHLSASRAPPPRPNPPDGFIALGTTRIRVAAILAYRPSRLGAGIEVLTAGDAVLIPDVSAADLDEALRAVGTK